MAKQVGISKLTKRFRIALEESWYHERPEVRNPDKRWYEIIHCKGFKKPPEQEGTFICLYSEDPPLLKLYADRPRNARAIWGAIKSNPGTKADFDLDGEAELLFPPELLVTVAKMAGGRKRRQLSEEHRSKLIEAGKLGREALLKWHKKRSTGE
ncbi:MAG: hypothetical protein ACLPYB_04655 [Desulfobaccales bacterium]